MCTMNFLEGVDYVVTQRTHFDKCCQFRDRCIRSHVILIYVFNPIIQNETILPVDSITVFYELCVYIPPPDPKLNNMPVARPSTISAFGEKLKKIFTCTSLSPLKIGVGVEGAIFLLFLKKPEFQGILGILWEALFSGKRKEIT